MGEELGELGATDYLTLRGWRGLQYYFEQLGYKCMLPGKEKPGIELPNTDEELPTWKRDYVNARTDLVPPVAYELPPWKKSRLPERLRPHWIQNPAFVSYQSTPSVRRYIRAPMAPPPAYGSKAQMEEALYERGAKAPCNIASYTAFTRNGDIGHWESPWKGLEGKPRWVDSPLRVEMDERAPRETLGPRTRLDVDINLEETILFYDVVGEVVKVKDPASGEDYTVAHMRDVRQMLVKMLNGSLVVEEIDPWVAVHTDLPIDSRIGRAGSLASKPPRPGEAVFVPMLTWLEAMLDILLVTLESAFEFHREHVGREVEEKIDRKTAKMTKAEREVLDEYINHLVFEQDMDVEDVVRNVLYEVRWSADEDYVRRTARRLIKSLGR